MDKYDSCLDAFCIYEYTSAGGFFIIGVPPVYDVPRQTYTIVIKLTHQSGIFPHENAMFPSPALPVFWRAYSNSLLYGKPIH